MKNSPYGKIVVLKEDATDVKCWNFTGKLRYTLPKGSFLRVKHAYDDHQTTCTVTDKYGNTSSMMLDREDTKQRGYRFIIPNEQLNRISNAGLPKKVYNVVEAIMRFEDGEMDDVEAYDLLCRLRDDGTLFALQGVYLRTAMRMGVIKPLEPRS